MTVAGKVVRATLSDCYYIYGWVLQVVVVLYRQALDGPLHTTDYVGDTLGNVPWCRWVSFN